MNNFKIEFIHLRNVDTVDGSVYPLGGTTVAYRTSSAGVTEYAIARCRDNENYVKALGRTKAAGRLESPAYRKTVAGFFDKDAFRKAVLTDVFRIGGGRRL